MPNRATTDVAYGDHPRQRLDIYTPRQPNGTLVVFWHGGSWRSGDKKTYRFVGRSLARLGYTAVLPNYRLYPDVTFPGFVEDGAAAVAYVQREFEPGKIIAMGHSAGALIAALVALDPRYLAAAGVPGAVNGLVGLSGAYDFKPAKALQPIFNGDTAVDIRASIEAGPVPALLVHGRADLVVKVSNSTKLATAIRSAGGRADTRLYGRLNHFTVLMPFLIGWWSLPTLRRALVRFINSV